MITACRQAMHIAKMIMAVENGDIYKNDPKVEECKNLWCIFSRCAAFRKRDAINFVKV